MGYPTRAYRGPSKRSVSPADPYKTPYKPPGHPGGGGYAEPLRRNPDVPQRHYEGGNQMRGPLGWVFGKNPWIAGFKFGWWLGNKLYDAWEAGMFHGAYLHYGGWTICCTGNGATASAGGGAGPCGACADFNSFSIVPGQWVATTPAQTTMRTMEVNVGAGTGGSNRIKYVHVYSKPVGVTTRPAWVPGKPRYQNWKWPHLQPYVYPMNYPPLMPKPDMMPRPYQTPDSPLPEATQQGQPTARPFAGPTVYTRTFTKTETKTVWKQRPDKQPVKGRTKETKLKFHAAAQTIIRGINAATEVGDLIEALYKSIDAKCKKAAGPVPRTGGKGPQLAAMSRAVWQCHGSIDWGEATFNIIWNDIEDRVWSKVGLSTKEFGRIQATNIGVNQILSQAYGDQVADMLKGAEGFVRQKIANKLGLTKP